jgi:hypothetical protein
MIKNNNMKNEKLYNWIFYFNPYEELWFAFKRESYQEFFTNRTKVKHIHSPEIEQLLEIINIIDE